MIDRFYSRSSRWLIFSVIAIATLIIYVLTSLDAGQGHLLMPLDDVYIHFQYARQMALGQPYQYNLIDPPTSGATSLLYPYVLTVGYGLGFQDLWLGLWAMLIGTIALIIALHAVYRLCIALDVPRWLALLTAITFGTSGVMNWHFMSGMETGITITLILLVLLCVIEKRLTSFVIVATLLTLTRPEGGIVAAIASATLFLRLWHTPDRYRLLWLALPILAFGTQPLVNWLMTGTTVATGAQAKSILSSVPASTAHVLRAIFDNWGRMWLELLTGYDGAEGRGWYLPLFTGISGLLVIPLWLFKRDMRLISLMLIAWFLALTLSISTLDNAFWHFKRYQMPMHALLFPLAAALVAEGLRRFPQGRYWVYAFDGVLIPIFTALMFGQFWQYYALNVAYVYQQPYQMALWLRDNTPPDSVIAVHDVGLMRYHGDRSTLDLVGLTTPNAAAYWRNGPGSVAEFLLSHQPDYIASYGRGHGYGLAYLADTALYANPRAEFMVDDWQPTRNVALAAPTQAIYQPDWEAITDERSACSYSQIVAQRIISPDPIFTLNVADIASETDFAYTWDSVSTAVFATEVRDFGGQTLAYRLLDRFESFTVPVHNADRQHDWLLVTDVHASSANSITISANGDLLDTQWIPNNPGTRHTIYTVIPSEYLTETLTLHITPHGETGFYMPICHSAYPITLRSNDQPALASFQDEVVALVDLAIEVSNQTFELDLDWAVHAQPQGDYRLFVHLYDDPNQPPLAQWDGYFARMPLGNWQSGLFDTRASRISFSIDILPAGRYQLAIGFYNPNQPTDRLNPVSEVYHTTPDGRLWLGEVEIE
ncbi:MAG: hypothetical protein ACFE0Q_05775 [Anaerolineae bacterium]